LRAEQQLARNLPVKTPPLLLPPLACLRAHCPPRPPTPTPAPAPLHAQVLRGAYLDYAFLSQGLQRYQQFLLLARDEPKAFLVSRRCRCCRWRPSAPQAGASSSSSLGCGAAPRRRPAAPHALHAAPLAPLHQVPLYDIDFLWHTHVSVSGAYRRDCQAVLGRLLDHEDSVGEDRCVC
jgi:hypothetical protein